MPRNLQRRDESVRARAHQLWEKAGRPSGRNDEFWNEALQELMRETAGATRARDAMVQRPAQAALPGRSPPA